MRLYPNGNHFKAGMRWFASLTRKNQIAYSVLALHFLFLLGLNIDYWANRRFTPASKIAVKTILYTQSASREKSEQNDATHTLTRPISSAASLPKKHPPQGAKSNTKKNTPTTTKLRPKAPIASTQKPKTTSTIDPKFLKQIEQDLDTFTAVSAETSDKTPITIPSFHFEFAPEIASEPKDIEKVSVFLQETLQLPEFGEVKMELTLAKGGKFESLKILESKSQKNTDFLKNQLPSLTFPCLNEAVLLTIVFRNET